MTSDAVVLEKPHGPELRKLELGCLENFLAMTIVILTARERRIYSGIRLFLIGVHLYQPGAKKFHLHQCGAITTDFAWEYLVLP